MAATYKLTATVRDRAGKGAARATRRLGAVPAVIYGDNQPPVMIALEARELRKHLAATFFTHVYQLDVNGKTHQVLPRDVQFDPVSDQPVHVDFMRVSAKTKITVKVPLEFINQEKAPGIKGGGLLNIVFHELELRVTPDKIPEHITIDLTGRNIGESIHLNDITLPAGVEVLGQTSNPTLATIAAPSALRSEENAAAATEAAPAAEAAKQPEKK